MEDDAALDTLSINVNRRDVTLMSTFDVVPALIENSGSGARFAYDEFFYGRIRNPYTRRNYQHAVRRFLDWAWQQRLELPRIAPKDIGQYLDGLSYAPPTKKLHLAGLRHFFDELVIRHVVILNPAASVRAERYQVVEGKTPEITVEQVRELFASIDTSNVVGLRDRAVITVLVYTAARVGAVAKLRLQDFYEASDQYCLRFADKGGKSREIPVRHDLQGFMFQYLETARLQEADKSSPLFRTAIRRTRQLTTNAMTSGDMARMIKRRMRAAGLPSRLSPHSFRVATITNLLSQNIPLEDVQNLAGHADPRTTRLYDRRHQRVTRNIVERISI
jgi:integrase/recombinase XerD